MANHTISVRLHTNSGQDSGIHLDLKEGTGPFGEALTFETAIDDGDTITIQLAPNSGIFSLNGIQEYSGQAGAGDTHFISGVVVHNNVITFGVGTTTTHGELVDHYKIGFKVNEHDASITWEDPKLKMRGNT